jgi:hypothetical protein
LALVRIIRVFILFSLSTITCSPKSVRKTGEKIFLSKLKERFLLCFPHDTWSASPTFSWAIFAAENSPRKILRAQSAARSTHCEEFRRETTRRQVFYDSYFCDDTFPHMPHVFSLTLIFCVPLRATSISKRIYSYTLLANFEKFRK